MMTKDGSRRIAASNGAILFDPDLIAATTFAAAATRAAGSADDEAARRAVEPMFDPQSWAARGMLAEVAAGRGAAWFVGESCGWVLRHYRRGGLVAQVSTDRYLWTGERRVRSFREWRLLAELVRLGLPVPRPVAARYVRSRLAYRCDLITVRIADAQPLSALLSHAPLPATAWRAVGAAVGRLHAAGADHADLNAHNILLAGDRVSVIDFDRGRLRQPGPWARGNLSRLRRSLRKIAVDLPPDRVTDASWIELLGGYAARGV